MAIYKVPQDVEADDKLVGPFSFRQFVYLLIAGILVGLAVGLAQLFPLLAIIPLPPVLLFLALALPLKKDQPMETYLAAIVSFYLKPRTRVWKSGQRDSTINITVPKNAEPSRVRDITEEEASHRLDFLSNIVDSEGYAIKGIQPNPNVNEEIMNGDEAAVDIFEGQQFDNLMSTITEDENTRRTQMMGQVQGTIDVTENGGMEYGETNMMNGAFAGVASNTVYSTGVDETAEVGGTETVESGMTAVAGEAANTDAAAVGDGVVADATASEVAAANEARTDEVGTEVMGTTVVTESETLPKTASISTTTTTQPMTPRVTPPAPHEVIRVPGIKRQATKAKDLNEKNAIFVPVENPVEKSAQTNPTKPSIMELTNNDVFTVATIEKEANRIKRKEEDEVFVSLH